MASSVAQNFEQLSYGGAASQWRGRHQQVIGDAVATRTLLPKEAGALCLFDRAAGVVYTLPPPVIGMEFDFAITVSVTSNAHKIITNASTVFLLGAVTMATIATATGAGFSADGSTIVSSSSNGTTSGGLLGSMYRLRALSATQWYITGSLIGSGTIITPFATS